VYIRSIKLLSIGWHSAWKEAYICEGSNYKFPKQAGHLRRKYSLGRVRGGGSGIGFGSGSGDGSLLRFRLPGVGVPGVELRERRQRGFAGTGEHGVGVPDEEECARLPDRSAVAGEEGAEGDGDGGVGSAGGGTTSMRIALTTSL
jgi:hypothetical protein